MVTVSIPLTQGKVAIIDEADYPLVSAHLWYATRHDDAWYATTHIRQSDGTRIVIQMHRLVMGLSDDHLIDHKSLNTLDNRRANLRRATHSQNKANSPRYKNNQSGFKGVYWSKQWKKWSAQIRHNKVLHHLGYFTDPVEAAHAYDAAAIQFHGAFARGNFLAPIVETPPEPLAPQSGTTPRIRSSNTSGYRGVSSDKRRGRWVAQIVVNGQHYSLGSHATAEDAARAYDEAARRLLGDAALCNFPVVA